MVAACALRWMREKSICECEANASASVALAVVLLSRRHVQDALRCFAKSVVMLVLELMSRACLEEDPLVPR